MKALGMTLLLCCFALACQPQGQTKPESKDVPNSQDAKAQDDAIEIPKNVVGSYLVCALRQEAKADMLEAQYGCRLSDSSTGKKLDVGGLALVWRASDEHVMIDELSSNPIYQALYTVRGASLENIQATVQGLEVAAELRTKSGSLIPLKRDKLQAVLKPALVLEDFEAPIVRQQSIQRDNPGSL